MTRPIQRVNAPAFGTEVVTSSIVLAAGADWWDPNTEGLCVVAAYRAINTPGNTWTNDRPYVYADTLVNNANPGTFDLVEVPPGPIPWTINIGWQFVAALTQCFDTGIVPDINYTLLVQFTNFIIGVAAGVDNINPGSPTAVYVQTLPAVAVRYAKGLLIQVAPQLVNGNSAVGNMAIGGYRDGVPEGAAHAWFGVQTGAMAVGAVYDTFAAAYAFYCTANVESVAIYSCILTDPQVLAVATAMSQL